MGIMNHAPHNKRIFKWSKKTVCSNNDGFFIINVYLVFFMMMFIPWTVRKKGYIKLEKLSLPWVFDCLGNKNMFPNYPERNYFRNSKFGELSKSKRV